MKKLFISLILGLGLSLGLVGLVGNGLTVIYAADFTVDVTNDENDGSCAPSDCSLREAIIAANGNGQADTITLGSGTYGLSILGANENAGATGDLDITAPLTITGQGPNQTIIDASGVISDRVFHINMSANAGTVVISGVTIINGNFAGSGGGIYNYDADLTLVNTVISNNITSSYGGGVAISEGSLTLDETQILSNTAGQRGGGVYVYQSAAAFTQTNGSLIAYNHVTGSGGFNGGGGVYVSNGSAMLNGGQIFSNTANDNGGGVYALFGSAVLAGGQIFSNTANNNGGGVYVYEGNTMLSGSEIRGNKANSGGGVYVDESAAVFTQTGDSEIAYNSGQAATGGGGLYIDEGSATLSGGQIHHNNTAGNGGGVHIHDGNATLNGGQIRSNTASNDGGGVYIFGSAAAFTQTGTGLIAHNISTANGGGVYVDNGRATLAGGQILDNNAIDGGGVYVDAGSTMLSGSEILNNTASSEGGGVYVYQGQATLSGGQIFSNTARFGGGVHVESVSAVFTQTGITTIAHNTASDDGGGVFVASGSASLSEGSIRNNNASGGLGGGVYVQNSAAKMNVNKEQIINNTAYDAGGGIYHNHGTLTLVNTTVSGNRATRKTIPLSQGGGLYVVDGTVVLTYNTIVSNTAASGGRGIHRTGGSVLLQDTIVAYHSVANCYPGSGPGLTSNGYNLDSGATCVLNFTGDITNADPLLGPLADNGGNTLTHALLEGSPAIDQGVCVAGVDADQRGVSRPKGTTCDIGAFEVEPAIGPATEAVYLPIIIRN